MKRAAKYCWIPPKGIKIRSLQNRMATKKKRSEVNISSPFDLYSLPLSFPHIPYYWYSGYWEVLIYYSTMMLIGFFCIFSCFYACLHAAALPPIKAPVKVGSLEMSPLGCGTWAWVKRKTATKDNLLLISLYD